MLLARQNELAASVLGETRECWLVQSLYQLPPGEAEISVGDAKSSSGAIADYGLEPAYVTTREAGTEFEERWESFAGLVRWTSGQFDGLLRDIADDQVAPTLWVSTETGAVFAAPYDGASISSCPTKAKSGNWPQGMLTGCPPTRSDSSQSGGSSAQRLAQVDHRLGVHDAGRRGGHIGFVPAGADGRLAPLLDHHAHGGDQARHQQRP